MTSMYLMQISALDLLPLTSPAYAPDLSKNGFRVIRHPSGVVVGATIDLRMSAIADYTLEYLIAVRNCLFSPDQEGKISLDNEGTEIHIELRLKADGAIECSASLPLEDGDDFSQAQLALPDGKSVRNDIIDEHGYEEYDLIFDSPASSWCESVIAMVKEESRGTYELADADIENVYDVSGYVKDLETFVEKFSKKRDDQTVDEILAQIEVSSAVPVIRPGANAIRRQNRTG